eukprot:3608964-Rhodomonas_salina.1
MRGEVGKLKRAAAAAVSCCASGATSGPQLRRPESRSSRWSEAPAGVHSRRAVVVQWPRLTQLMGVPGLAEDLPLRPHHPRRELEPSSYAPPGSLAFCMLPPRLLCALWALTPGLCCSRLTRLPTRGPGRAEPSVRDCGTDRRAWWWQVEFPVTPTRLLAQSFEVPEDKVAAFEVELQLTPTEV